PKNSWTSWKSFVARKGRLVKTRLRALTQRRSPLAERDSAGSHRMRISFPVVKRLVLPGLIALVSPFLLSPANADGKPSFTVRPEPAWVKAIEINRDSGSRDRPTSVLLDDFETNL